LLSALSVMHEVNVATSNQMKAADYD
jgi:hypothetical protein